MASLQGVAEEVKRSLERLEMFTAVDLVQVEEDAVFVNVLADDEWFTIGVTRT